MTVLRSMAHARGHALPASPLGKVKLVAQVGAILILILGRGHMRDFFILGQVALWIATVAALVSAVDYSRRINAILAVAPSPRPPARSPCRSRTPSARVIESALDVGLTAAFAWLDLDLGQPLLGLFGALAGREFGEQPLVVGQGLIDEARLEVDFTEEKVGLIFPRVGRIFDQQILQSRDRAAIELDPIVELPDQELAVRQPVSGFTIELVDVRPVGALGIDLAGTS